jgi:hypothetical protein
MITRRNFIRTATCAAAAGSSGPAYSSTQSDLEKITAALVGCAHIHTLTHVNVLASAGIPLRLSGF